MANNSRKILFSPCSASAVVWELIILLSLVIVRVKDFPGSRNEKRTREDFKTLVEIQAHLDGLEGAFLLAPTFLGALLLNNAASLFMTLLWKKRGHLTKRESQMRYSFETSMGFCRFSAKRESTQSSAFQIAFEGPEKRCKISRIWYFIQFGLAHDFYKSPFLLLVARIFSGLQKRPF